MRAWRRVQYACAAADKLTYTAGIRSKRALTLPNFLGIGAQKAGTSWLHRNLRCHPALFLPQQKELHYWDTGFHRSLRFYAGKFAAAGDRVKGEITPAYSTIPAERVRVIHRLMPDLRLIFLMRNPVDRAWSHALMQFVKQQRRRIEEVPPDEVYAHFRSLESRLRGDYLRTLENWLGAFPEELLLCGFFEEVTADPQGLLVRVFRHLGVSEAVDWAQFPLAEKVNEGPGTEIPPHYRAFLEELYAPEIERLHDRFGEKVAGWRRPV
jgi:hypothetical protein